MIVLNITNGGRNSYDNRRKSKRLCRLQSAVCTRYSYYGKDEWQYDGFKAGAEWMLEKADKRLANTVSEFDTLLYLIDKKSEGLINKENTVETFMKALAE